MDNTVQAVPKFENVRISNCDFTGAKLDNARISESIFERCIFDHCILTNLTALASNFVECSFQKADMRKSSFYGMGPIANEFTSCEFSGANLKMAAFNYNIFTNMTFDSRDWSRIQFDDSPVIFGAIENIVQSKASFRI